MINRSLKKSAFTLAETLLTLAIVGVIAAMTIPSLKDFSDEVKYVTAAKKAYTNVQSATTALETRYGDLKWWPWAQTTEMSTRYKGVLNSLPQLTTDTYSIAFLDGNDWTNVTEPNWFQTTDGMVWSLSAYNNSMGSVGAIYVDTNGPAVPNRVGVDVLGFVVTNDGVFPMNDKIHDKSADWGCAYYAIKTGKMPWVTDTSYQNCKDPRIDGI